MDKKENISFEIKIENAKKLLDNLIKPDITLENSVAIYKNGLKELDEAQKLLDEAKAQFEILTTKD